MYIISLPSTSRRRTVSILLRRYSPRVAFTTVACACAFTTKLHFVVAHLSHGKGSIELDHTCSPQDAAPLVQHKDSEHPLGNDGRCYAAYDPICGRSRRRELAIFAAPERRRLESIPHRLHLRATPAACDGPRRAP